jgi:hypothetical protein
MALLAMILKDVGCDEVFSVLAIEQFFIKTRIISPSLPVRSHRDDPIYRRTRAESGIVITHGNGPQVGFLQKGTRLS